MRFVWSVGPMENSCKGFMDVLFPKLDAAKLTEIVGQYGQALASLDPTELNMGAMSLEGIRLSIGRTAGGGFVVGSLEAQKWGYIDFARNQDIAKTPRSINSVAAEKIEKGLRQALSLSRRFVSAASQARGAIMPQGVTTRFSADVSSNGSKLFSLALIQNKASIALRFLRLSGSERSGGNGQNAVAVQWHAAGKWSFPWTLGLKIQPEITTVDLFPTN